MKGLASSIVIIDMMPIGLFPNGYFKQRVHAIVLIRYFSADYSNGSSSFTFAFKLSISFKIDVLEFFVSWFSRKLFLICPHGLFWNESGRGIQSSSWDGESGYRVHVSDLAVGVSRKEIEKVFAKYGPINEIWVATNPPCFAFVNYKHRSDADKAIREGDGK